MQFKLKEDELAALLGNNNNNNNGMQQYLMMKMLFGKDEEKKDEKKEEKPKVWSFLGYEIKQKKRESAGSLMLWAVLALMAFSSYVDIAQTALEHYLRSALQ